MEKQYARKFFQQNYQQNYQQSKFAKLGMKNF